VLALEIALAWRSTEDSTCDAPIDPRDELGQSTLGRTAHSCEIHCRLGWNLLERIPNLAGETDLDTPVVPASIESTRHERVST
jgi:hypothetical protein